LTKIKPSGKENVTAKKGLCFSCSSQITSSSIKEKRVDILEQEFLEQDEELKADHFYTQSCSMKPKPVKEDIKHTTKLKQVSIRASVSA